MEVIEEPGGDGGIRFSLCNFCNLQLFPNESETERTQYKGQLQPPCLAMDALLDPWLFSFLSCPVWRR